MGLDEERLDSAKGLHIPSFNLIDNYGTASAVPFFQTPGKGFFAATGIPVEFTVHMCGSGSGSGSDALTELPGFDPDNILLDIIMPGMDGPDNFRAIRRLDGYESVPIIFMAAKVMEKDREQYRSLGAAGIIAKPFDPMALSDQIREI